jgi:hypothetical protein
LFFQGIAALEVLEKNADDRSQAGLRPLMGGSTWRFARGVRVLLVLAAVIAFYIWVFSW